MDRRDFLRYSAGIAALGMLKPASANPTLEPAGGRGKLDIPTNTWVARPLPGPGKAPASGKDFRMAFNPLDQQLYIGFGDWGGPWGPNSGRQELYSYHAGRDQWTLVVPYCMGEGHIQPSGPDELGWVFDTNREIFWMIPGFQWKHDCASGVKDKVMTFDPRTREWSIVEGIDRIPADILYCQYDHESDSILSFAYDGGGGAAIDIIDCKTVKKRRKFFRDEVDNARIARNYSALDPKTRTLYGIDTKRGKLYGYDLDSGFLAQLGDTPFNPKKENQALMAWNTNHDVLLWPYKDLLYVYHPDRDTWETRRPPQPEGVPVFGQSVGYDPYHDAIAYMGGYFKKNEHLFLYRYAPE